MGLRLSMVLYDSILIGLRPVQQYPVLFSFNYGTTLVQSSDSGAMSLCAVCGGEHFDNLFLESIAKKESALARLAELAQLIQLQRGHANGLKSMHSLCDNKQMMLKLE